MDVCYAKIARKITNNCTHTHTKQGKNFTNKSFNSIRINNIWIVTVIAQGESKEKSFNLKCAYIFFRVCICVCAKWHKDTLLYLNCLYWPILFVVLPYTMPIRQKSLKRNAIIVEAHMYVTVKVYFVSSDTSILELVEGKYRKLCMYFQ